MPDAGLPLSLVGAGGAYALGLDHAQHSNSSNSSISSSAAGFERIERRNGRERMRGRGHCFARIGRRAAGQVEVAKCHRESFTKRREAGP